MAAAEPSAKPSSFFDFTVLDSKDAEYPLSQHRNKVILAVNVASKCGFTPQYDGLEALYKKITEKYPNDFLILGFPSNQFGGQEPGTNEEIQEFCRLNFGVSFPVLAKIDVNGAKEAPVYNWLKAERKGLLGLKVVKWNFEKFLIGRDGQVKGRWSSITKPETLEAEIIKEIETNKPAYPAEVEDAKKEIGEEVLKSKA
jgi:glutathione peroxidase-family protein